MTEPFPTSWVISVCRTCGRHAVWPFCQHRKEQPADGRLWYAPVLVSGEMYSSARLPGKTPASTEEADRG